MDQYLKLSTDLGLYAAVCLKIRPKAGALTSLEFNATQRFLHGRLDAQLEKNGKVRALVLKGRQTGVSTYVGARLYWKVTHRQGCRARILTHLQDATDNLFGIVQRFHDHTEAAALTFAIDFNAVVDESEERFRPYRGSAGGQAWMGV